MKRVAIAMTLGLSVAATQGCATDSADTMDVGSADQALVCNEYTYSQVMAALLVALTDETGELHPTKYLTVQTNKYGSGKDGVSLNSVATAKCTSLGNGMCDATEMLLGLQVPGLNPAVDKAVLDVEDYRSNLVSKLKDQVNYENSRALNGQCLPPSHSLTLAGSSAATCGTHYEFDMAGAGGGGSFEVTREAESYNALNRNNSQHNWTLSGGSMTVGPDWAYTWTSNIPASSPNLSYTINFPAAGNYTVWVRGMGSSLGNDSVYVGLDGTTNGIAMDFPENSQYGWVPMGITVSSAGNHNVHLYAREDGFFADKLVVNQNSTTPPGGGSGVTCASPADLIIRIDRFQVNSSGNVNFTSDANSIFLDPDDIVDPIGGGSGSGSNVCSATPPTNGSDKLTIPYSADKEGDCCWQNYVQKTYKKHLQNYLICKL